MCETTIAYVKRKVLLALEDMGGCATRLRELEEGLPMNEEDYREDLCNWLSGAQETLREAELLVRAGE